MLARRLLLPASDSWAPDAAWLLLRVWTGLAMALLHGWPKIADFDVIVQRFPDALGIGSPAVNLALSASAEFGAALLLAAGLGTRAAALVLTVNMSVAWLVGHGAQLSGPRSGETAFIYLAVFVAVAIAGPGRLSADAWLGRASPEQ